ncbi:MAG: trehalose-6-phosphate synthase [Deltaproteobacteria bacterium]|nr:trehalose-6-phosphate synthase [Deltaproteobacteria bacterium]
MVSNREPYIHRFFEDEIRCVMPVSGMALVIDLVMQICGGTWIAYGSGEADKDVVDSNDHIQVPPENPNYTLRRVWLTKEEVDGYYYGFANEGLWPLCHNAYTRPIFRESDWDMYRKVNEKFARIILEEMGDNEGFVFIQDYHFALLSKILKEKRPDIIVAQFWHIPWPNEEVWRICPWGKDILEGLLGNDLFGFHIRYHCQNFLDTTDRFIEARVDREKSSVIREEKETLVRPFPISVDFGKIENMSRQVEVENNIRNIRKRYRLNNRFIGIGVDRIDYIKGILERFAAIDRFFEKYPQYIGHFTFFQLGPLSRIRLQQYKDYNNEIYHSMVEINEKYKYKDWQPIVLHKAHFSQQDLINYYRLADVCIVSSLHDGMNLVAKEFVASRWDNDGVLILSRFTGSARELDTALLINPFSTDQFVDTIKEALEMTQEEKEKRMERMREIVMENNIYRWTANIFSEIFKLGLEEI